MIWFRLLVTLLTATGVVVVSRCRCIIYHRGALQYCAGLAATATFIKPSRETSLTQQQQQSNSGDRNP